MMFLTFDVECDGLHGKTFAFGYTLTTQHGQRLMEGSHHAAIFVKDDWVKANILPVLGPPDTLDFDALCAKFHDVLIAAQEIATEKKETLYLTSDVPFPCEVNFLREVQRRYPGIVVYPLIDVASVLLAKGYDPVGTYYRKEDETPAHNPLNDARQSSRILHAVLNHESIFAPQEAQNG